MKTIEIPPGLFPILRGVVGSTVHGTSVEGTDDRDEMAIVIESPERSLGVGERFDSVFLRTQPEGVRSGPDDIDLQVHSLRKFVKLALGGNPSILTMLFLPEYMYIPYLALHPYFSHCSPGQELQALAPEFWSVRAVDAFLGYMHQQRERLAGERGQKNVSRPELVEKYGYDTKYAGHIIRLGYQGYEYATSGKLTLPMNPHEAEQVKKVRLGGYSLKEVLETADSLENLIRSVREVAPPQPNTERVNDWMVGTYLTHWRTWNV